MRSALAPLLPLLPLFAALSVDELVLSGRCDFREVARPGPFVHEPAIVRADNETALPPALADRAAFVAAHGDLEISTGSAPVLHHFGDREWARQRSTVGKLLSEAAGCELDPVAHF